MKWPDVITDGFIARRGEHRTYPPPDTDLKWTDKAWDVLWFAAGTGRTLISVGKYGGKEPAGTSLKFPTSGCPEQRFN